MQKTTKQGKGSTVIWHVTTENSLLMNYYWWYNSLKLKASLWCVLAYTTYGWFRSLCVVYCWSNFFCTFVVRFRYSSVPFVCKTSRKVIICFHFIYVWSVSNKFPLKIKSTRVLCAFDAKQYLLEQEKPTHCAWLQSSPVYWFWS